MGREGLQEVMGGVARVRADGSICWWYGKVDE